MPHKKREVLFQDGAYVFEMRFRDGVVLPIWVSERVKSVAGARKLVQQVSGPLGKLPTLLRSKLNHVVIQDGNSTANAEDKGHFFVLYDKNMQIRIANNDLEETVFHEAMHASIQLKHLKKSAWRKAVRKDKGFVTEYARTNAQEDFAESALFAYTLLRNPERLPKDVALAVRKIMPNRLAYFDTVFPAKGKEFYKVAPFEQCN